MKQKQRYDQLWQSIDIQNPEIWSLWKIIKDFQKKKNLEIGPGNYPKIPIKNGFFLDISETAINSLKQLGANTVTGDATNLPFENEFFDFVAAIEVLEHIENDGSAFSEIARALKPSGFFLFSVPLKMELYNEVDRLVGHYRRYEIKELQDLLLKNNFKILKYRYPSFYVKKLNAFLSSSRFTKALYKSKSSWSFFHVPGFLLNLGAKTWAFVERKGAPEWQTDIENLEKYPGRDIAIFCQKK